MLKLLHDAYNVWKMLLKWHASEVQRHWKKLKWPIKKNIDFEKAIVEISKDYKYLVWTVIFVVLEWPVLKLIMSLEKQGEEKSSTDCQTRKSDSI